MSTSIPRRPGRADGGPARPRSWVARLWLPGGLRPGELVPRPRAQRLVRLYSGLVLFGVSIALLLRARLGLDPWDVFHQGLARRTGVPIGLLVNATGVAVLLLWIPIRQRPGLGTVSNAILVGLVLDAVLPLFPQPRALLVRAVLLVAGIAANAVATALYIGAGLGPGPRDGLMTGLAARGWPIRRVRTLIELTVLAAGWLLGGSVGVGTLLYAVSIGPLAHVLIPKLTMPEPSAAGSSITGPSITGPSSTGPSITGPSSTGPSSTDQPGRQS